MTEFKVNNPEKFMKVYVEPQECIRALNMLLCDNSGIHSTTHSGKPEIWIPMLVWQFSVIQRKIGGFSLRIAGK